MRSLSLFVAVPVFVVLGTACAPRIDNVAGQETVYQDSESQGMVSGVGIESQDVIAMTDRLMRDILSAPGVAGHDTPPRVIIDSKYFENQSVQRMDKNLIINRMRVQLQRAAKGRLIFVGREHADMVAKERDLKRSDEVDIGTTGLTKAQLGADYRLTGQINSLDARSSSSGATERYTQITMALIDLETSRQVWAGMYEFTKAGQEDAVYR